MGGESEAEGTGLHQPFGERLALGREERIVVVRVGPALTGEGLAVDAVRDGVVVGLGLDLHR